MAVAQQQMLIERLATCRAKGVQPDEHAVAVIELGVAPFGLDVALLQDSRAFGANRGTDNVGVGIVVPGLR